MIMKHIIAAIAIALTVSVALGIPGTKAEEAAYTPEPGDEVVIYLVKYKPESFDEGKMVLAKGFGKAMQKSGQTRLTYFLEDEENHATVTVSFFKKGHETKEWHDQTKRQEVLDQLKLLWREPVSFEKFKLIEAHATK